METVNFEQMRDLIIELNLPKTVLDLFDGKCENKQLKQNFAYPWKILDYPEYQHNYFVDRYKPFLADDYCSTIYAYDIITKKYVKYYIELCKKECLVPMSWDSLFISYIEFL